MGQCSGIGSCDQRVGPRHILLVLTLIVVHLGCTEHAHSAIDDALKTLLENNGAVALGLRRLGTGHSVLSGRINGVTGLFVLDTGAETTVLHKPMLQKFRVDPNTAIGSEIGAGAGGVIDVKYFRGLQLQLGGYALELPRIASTDLGAIVNGLAASTREQIDGVLGQDGLVLARGIIDVSGDQLYLGLAAHGCKSSGACDRPIDRAMAERGFDRISLNRLSIGLLSISASVNGASGEFILDSGTRTSYIHSGSLERFSISEDDVLERVADTSGAGGTVRARSYRISTLKLLDRLIEKPTIAAADLSAVVDSIALRGQVRVDGVIGLDVLLPQHAVIDVGAGFLFLRNP